MSADNFNFIANDGTTYPNLSASTYWGVPMSKTLMEVMGERAREIDEGDWTEYGDWTEDTDWNLLDELLPELLRLRVTMAEIETTCDSMNETDAIELIRAKAHSVLKESNDDSNDIN